VVGDACTCYTIYIEVKGQLVQKFELRTNRRTDPTDRFISPAKAVNKHNQNLYTTEKFTEAITDCSKQH